MRSGTRRLLETDHALPTQLTEEDRADRDTYFIGILRALDRRIVHVSAMLDDLPGPKSQRHAATPAQQRELIRRLADLQTARENLLDIAFRCS